MISPAQRCRQRKLAAAQQQNATQESYATASAYELQLLQLAEDKQRLKALQSNEAKAELKRELLPKHIAWVEGAIKSNSGRQDDIVTTTMLWCLDAQQFNDGLDIAEYVLEHGMVMPDAFKRTAATVVAEEIADAALSAADIDVPLSALERAEKLTFEHDMHDQVRAKLHKALGNQYATAERWQDAVASFERALALNDRAGCKEDLKRAQRELKKALAEQSEE